MLPRCTLHGIGRGIAGTVQYSIEVDRGGIISGPEDQIAVLCQHLFCITVIGPDLLIEQISKFGPISIGHCIDDRAYLRSLVVVPLIGQV